MKVVRRLTKTCLLPLAGLWLYAIPSGAQQPAANQLQDVPKPHRTTAHRRLSAKFMERLDRDRAEMRFPGGMG